MIGHLTEAEMIEMLSNNVLGRIGCTDGSCVYVVPINYLFDGKNIICHSQIGQKVRMMQQNPNVCFEIDEMKSFTNWKSVVVNGIYEEITDEKEKWQVMESFVESMMRLKISESANPPEMVAGREHPRTRNINTVVYKIVVQHMSGRFEGEAS